MSETPVHETQIPPFELAAESIDESFDKIIARISNWYCILQAEKSRDDFIQEFLSPIMLSEPGVPIKLSFAAYTSSKHSEQVLRGLMTVIFDSCVYCVTALKAEAGGRQVDAWNHIANAMFRLGKLEGMGLLEPAVTHVIKTRSTKGATTRNAKFTPIRERARELAVPHQTRETKRKAALLIKKAVLAFAEQKGVEMSEYEAERTIIKWLDGMAFATK